MNKPVKAAARKQQKKTYSKPKLTTHGDVAKLTQHGHHGSDCGSGHGRPGAGSGLFDMDHGDHGHD